MKARFTTEQPAVSWQPLDNGMVDVTICLNGQEVTEENQQMVEKEQYITVTDTFWEYDFHQFREKAENVKLWRRIRRNIWNMSHRKKRHWNKRFRSRRKQSGC